MMHKNISHARTVVPECWKGDDESQWERAKFDPPPPKNALTDGHQNLCRWLRQGYLPPSQILFKIGLEVSFLRMSDFAPRCTK